MEDKTVFGIGSRVEFASFGRNTLAYIKPVDRDSDLTSIAFDEGLPMEGPLWGLFSADGEPIALSETRSSLFQDAEELELTAVSHQ